MSSVAAKDVAVAEQIMRRERVWRRLILSQVGSGQRASGQTWAQAGTQESSIWT